MYFRQEDLGWLRQRLDGSLPDIRAELDWMASSVTALDPTSSQATSNASGWIGEKGQAAALLALLDGNATYASWAVRWARALADQPIPTDDGLLRGTCQRIAAVYDWLHDSMSSSDRSALRDRLIVWVEAVGNLGYMKSPGYIGGHERWGYAVYAMGLLALHGEYDQADAGLAQCRQHILKGFYPAQAWIASDGGYHMGWGYTAAYTNFDQPYLIWTTGTNDVVLDDWMGELAYWYLYGLQGDKHFSNAGDAFAIDTSFGAENIIYAAGIGKLGHARWLLNGAYEKGTDAMLQLLFLDPSVASTAPDDIPLARRFQQAGLVVARDAWDETTTHFTFKSGQFQSTNHHHRDENTFTIHYKAPLAIDSGYYDAYGSTHWTNYFTRTVAHNGVLVYDPAQAYEVYGQSVSNDGGQLFRTEPKTVQEIQPGGPNALVGLVRYENRPAFTYASGDATQAYDTTRVTLAQREVVYLRSSTRDHPVVVVFDRVGAASTGFEKRFLLHTVDQPTVTGRSMMAEQGGGRLTSLTLLPVDAQLSLAGGPGHEAWVDGTNYPYATDAAQGSPVGTGILPGAWRLEVSPGVEHETDYFLHALFVDDATAPSVPDDAAVLLSDETSFGTQVAGWAVVFPKASATVTQLSYTVAQSGTFHHLVTGFSPAAHYVVSVAGTHVAEAQAGEGGCILFDAAVTSGQVVDIQ